MKIGAKFKNDNLVFPGWIPGEGAALCAKFKDLYKSECFESRIRKNVEKPLKETKDLGPKKLQRELDLHLPHTFCTETRPKITLVVCFGLMNTLRDCLVFFNKKCSNDFLNTGKGDFTSASLSIINKKLKHLQIFRPEQLAVMQS